VRTSVAQQTAGDEREGVVKTEPKAGAWNELADVLIEERLMKPKPKVHKRDRDYTTRPMCGAHSKRLTDVNAEVTCKSCRGWFPVGEREVPRE
jgi:hypothetical protein